MIHDALTLAIKRAGNTSARELTARELTARELTSAREDQRAGVDQRGKVETARASAEGIESKQMKVGTLDNPERYGANSKAVYERRDGSFFIHDSKRGFTSS